MRVSLSPAASAKVRELPGWLRYALISIGIVVIWQLYASFSGVSQLLFVSPIATVQALITDTINGQLPSAMLVSLQNLAIGMITGILIGLGLASLASFSRF